MKWHKCQSIGLKPVVFGLKTNFELQTEVKQEGRHQRTPQKGIPWTIRNQGISRYPKGRPPWTENLIRGYQTQTNNFRVMTQAPFPAQQKASLAIDHASEALSLCAIAKRGSGTCPYIPTYFLACLPFLRRESTATAAATAATAAIAPAMPNRLSPVLAAPETAAFTKETGSSAAAGPSGS